MHALGVPFGPRLAVRGDGDGEHMLRIAPAHRGLGAAVAKGIRGRVRAEEFCGADKEAEAPVTHEALHEIVHSDAVAAHEQPVHALKWAGPAVWTAAGCALALWACSGDLWSKQWSCNLSQPAELMAPSADGALLATAGRFDRLVKVWHRTQDGFAFSYLHHPHGLQSIEWAPLATESGLCAASSRNVLLTLCRGGVARLWSSTHAPERALHVESALLAAPRPDTPASGGGHGRL